MLRDLGELVAAATGGSRKTRPKNELLTPGAPRREPRDVEVRLGLGSVAWMFNAQETRVKKLPGESDEQFLSRIEGDRLYFRGSWLNWVSEIREMERILEGIASGKSLEEISEVEQEPAIAQSALSGAEVRDHEEKAARTFAEVGKEYSKRRDVLMRTIARARQRKEDVEKMMQLLDSDRDRFMSDKRATRALIISITALVMSAAALLASFWSKF